MINPLGPDRSPASHRLNLKALKLCARILRAQTPNLNLPERNLRHWVQSFCFRISERGRRGF